MASSILSFPVSEPRFRQALFRTRTSCKCLDGARSVSNLLIEGDTLWAGLVTHPEGADRSGGLLRHNFKLAETQKYPIEDVIIRTATFAARIADVSAAAVDLRGVCGGAFRARQGWTVPCDPGPESATWQILALNTEKAHNLKERSREVERIYRGLLDEDGSRNESDFAFYLEEADLVTLGFCYEKKPAFAGGAYHLILRRLEQFEDAPLKKTVKQQEARAEMVLDLASRTCGKSCFIPVSNSKGSSSLIRN